MRVIGNGNPLYVLCDMRQVELAWPSFDAGAVEEAGDGRSIRAPIIGRVAKVFVQKGEAVSKGDRIAVVEAMKMEHVLHAQRSGVIEQVAAKEGEQVALGALIAVTVRVSSPQSETLRTVYETPGDLIRLALGFAVGLWIVIHLFMLPRTAEGYRTWVYLGLVVVPLAWAVAIYIW